MRIIAGKKRATNLYSPKGDVSRPITDRIKESLFNVLYSYGLPEGKVVADLFSGVGSLGLEALSRGAKFALFVERDHNVASVLQKNIEKCGFVKESKIMRANAFLAGAKNIPGQDEYGLVFVDPPYADSRDTGPQSALGGIMDILNSQLSAAAMVVVRTEINTVLPESYGRIKILERREWGSMAINILLVGKNE